MRASPTRRRPSSDSASRRHSAPRRSPRPRKAARSRIRSFFELPRAGARVGDMMADQLEREITPPEVYFKRRAILRGGVMAATAAGTALLYRKLNGVALATPEGTRIAGLVKPEHSPSTWVAG